MTAMTHDRNTTRRDGDQFSFPVAAGKRIYTGAVVVIQPDGYAAPGQTATGLHSVGLAQAGADNTTGSNGAISVSVRRGCFALKQGADPVTLADVGKVCYLVDDQTVAKTDGTGTRSQAGVIRDVVISRLGTSHHKNHLRRPMRLVMARVPNRTGKMTELWLLTDRLELPADLVALAYRYRWTIELFFHWLKNVLGCKHLFLESPNGVAIQVYVALIASLLIVLWTGCKPTRSGFPAPHDGSSLVLRPISGRRRRRFKNPGSRTRSISPRM